MDCLRGRHHVANEQISWNPPEGGLFDVRSDCKIQCGLEKTVAILIYSAIAVVVFVHRGSRDSAALFLPDTQSSSSH
jgi:hypothetical protein